MAEARQTGRDGKERDRERETGRETQGERQKNARGRKKSMKETLNQWSEEKMRGAIAEYKEIRDNSEVPKLSMLARAWNVPKSTL